MSPKKSLSVATDTLSKLVQLNLSQCEPQLCLASLKDDEVLLQRVQVSRSVQEEFKLIAVHKLTELGDDLLAGEKIVQDYDAQYKPDFHEVEYISLSKHPVIQGQIGSGRSPAALALFQAEEAFIDGLRFYIVVIKLKGTPPILLFRTYSPRKELARSAKFAVLFESGQYDRIEKPVFLFDREVDCIGWGDSLFILNKHNFQQIFRFYELVEAAAKQTLNIIKLHVPIENFESFEADCFRHKQKLAKLRNIAGKPYLSSLTIRDLKKVIELHGLPVKTSGKGKKEKIVYDASDKWAILRLLDDDYLDSYMTGIKYEVNSKREQSH